MRINNLKAPETKKDLAGSRWKEVPISSGYVGPLVILTIQEDSVHVEFSLVLGLGAVVENIQSYTYKSIIEDNLIYFLEETRSKTKSFKVYKSLRFSDKQGSATLTREDGRIFRSGQTRFIKIEAHQKIQENENEV